MSNFNYTVKWTTETGT